MRLSKSIKEEVLKTGKELYKRLKRDYKEFSKYEMRIVLEKELLKLGVNPNTFQAWELLYVPSPWDYDFSTWVSKDYFKNHGNLWNQLNELQKVKLLIEIMKED